MNVSIKKSGSINNVMLCIGGIVVVNVKVAASFKVIV